MAESGEEWELSKENIRPIQQGRKQKVLKVALAPHPEEIIAQQRQSFENELRTYSGNDPLFVWCKYINWVEQNYPKGGKEGHIKQLMERCLSILKDEQKYFDDNRFIDIMLKYADLSGKPLEIYNYMYTNNIGCKSAKFFINWSWEIEQLGNLKKADEILTEGIQRKVQPFEKLKSYHADFEIRLATKIKASLEGNNFEPENGRSAFAVLKPQKKNLAPVLRTGETVVEKKQTLLLNRQQPQPKSVKSSVKVPFKIYNSENINPSLPVQTQSVWSSLNPENYKENEQKPSKWNKVKVKSRGLSNETNPDFKFHCDDDKDEHLCTPRSVPKTSSILSTRCRTPSPPIAFFEPPDPMKKPMYPKNKVYGGAEEYSLEEIRAAAWFECKKKAEQEKLLAEQQRKIEEQAKKEEKLKRQVEYLEKKVKLLQNHFPDSCTKSSEIFNASEVNTHEFDNTLNNQKGESIVNGVNKMNSKNIQNSNVESAFSSANQLAQQFCNKSLSHPADKIESKIFDLSKEFNKQCSILTGNKSAYNELPHTDHAYIPKEGINLPFTFYQDPTTNIISNSDVSSKEFIDVITSKQPNEVNSISKNSGKLSFSLFHDHTETISQELANVNTAKEELQNSSKASNHKLPFTFCTDSNEKISSDLSEIVSSKKLLSAQNLIEARGTSKESNDLPFTFYHDPTSAIPNVAEIIHIEKPNCKENPHEESSDEDIENIPPKDYVQNTTKRELAGILKPSKNIVFIPLEEQELDDDSDSDFEDFIYQKRIQLADETLIPPSNTEQFSTAKFLASTPCVTKNCKGINLEKSNQFSFKVEVSQNTSHPVENTSEKKNFIDEENIAMKSEQKSSKESGSNSNLKSACYSRLPNVLSAIMETSNENYSKSSSSSSSASLTKSNHLDQNSAHHISVNKQQSKLEPRDLCSITEVSDQNSEYLHSSDMRHKPSNEENDIFELYSVDIDPFDPKETQKHLKSINLCHYKNIYDNNSLIRTVRISENIQIGNDTYFIENLIAEGAYAKVFKAIKPFEIYGCHSNKPLALKVCKKANEWEFYICHEIQRRLSEKKLLPDIRNSVMNIIFAIKYSDGIILVSEFGHLSTLLNIINFYKKQNSALPELLAMFFTLEMLHIVSKLHECNIIHGDIKPDNFLLKSLNSSHNVVEDLSKATSCLQLIDFGRAIDLNLYDKGICFTKTFSATHFKCNEMKDQKPWVFQLDWYGVLSCIHAMLFLEYMTVSKKSGVWGIDKKFKRYWFNSLWEPLFNKLLNIPGCYEEPDVTFFINMIESKLQQNASSFIGQFSRFADAYSKRK